MLIIAKIIFKIAESALFDSNKLYIGANYNNNHTLTIIASIRKTRYYLLIKYYKPGR